MDKYEDISPAFEDSREFKLVNKLIEAWDEKSSDEFAEAITDYDRITRIDEWLTVVTQYLFVEYGGEYTKTVPLTQRDWLVTVLIGSISIPIGFFTRLIAGAASSAPAKPKGD